MKETLSKFTKRSLKAMETAVGIARSKSINVIFPEILLKAILENPDDNLFCTKIANNETVNIINRFLDNHIESYHKTRSSGEPSFDHDLYNLLNDAEKFKKGEFISIDLLTLLCLKHLGKKRRGKNDNGLQKIENWNELIKNLENEVNSSKINSPDGDDPVNPMEKYAVEMVALPNQINLIQLLGEMKKSGTLLRFWERRLKVM